MIQLNDITELLSSVYNREGDSPDTGFNCYSLAKYVRENYFFMYTPSIKLHSFTPEEGQVLITGWNDHWAEVTDKEPGDMVFMREAGHKTWHHCGVLLDNDQVIHAYEGLGMFGRISIHPLSLLKRRFEDVTFARWQE